MMPTASVIIPTYNGEQTVGPAVHSVLSQEFNDYEIIIGDDCSTDQTSQILDYLEGRYSYITTYRWTSNLGIPKNINRLVKRSSGEILFFLDQDDYWLSEKMVKHVSKHKESNSSVVYSNYIRIDRNEKKLNISSPPHTHDSRSLVERLYEHGNFIGTFSAVSVSRCAWEANDGLDERLDVSADFDLWVRLANSYEFSHIDEELVAKRIYEGNYSNNYSLMHNDNILILSKAIDLYPNIRKQEKCIRARLAYRHANAAFRDGNPREAVYQACYSLQFRLHFKPIMIAILAILDLFSYSLNVGTKLYDSIYKSINDILH